MALAADKRAQILDGAVEVFQELGFSGASMDRIAARAQVSKRTVYNHFESKEVLFRAIVTLMAEAASQALTVAFRPDQPIERQLYDLGWAEGRLLTDPSFMRMARMVMCETMRDPVLAEEASAKMEHFKIFEHFMAKAREAGLLRIEDPVLAAEQFLGLIKTRAFWPVIFSGVPVGRAEMETIIRDAVRIFLNSYGPEETEPAKS